MNFDIQDNEAFEPQIPICKTGRKSRPTNVMDREGAAPPAVTPSVPHPGSATHSASAPMAAPSSSVPGAATNLDYAGAPNEAAEARRLILRPEVPWNLWLK